MIWKYSKVILNLNIKYRLDMKIFKIMLLVILALSLNVNYTMNNATTLETFHAHDVKFSVFVKYGEQLVSKATVKVLINNREVALGITNEVGKVDLLVKSYEHEKATIVVSHEGQIATMNNVTLQNGKFYYLEFSNKEGNKIEKVAEEKKVPLLKAEQYEDKLKKINKSQIKIDKANSKLDKAQKKLDEKRKNISEDAEFLKVKDRQRRIDKQRDKYKARQLELNNKLKSLNKKYNK